MVFVSPNHTDLELRTGAIDDIEVFRDQIDGWLFAQAERLRNDERAALALLNLTTPYFETIACYLMGKESRGASDKFLRAGLCEVFGNADDDVLAAFATEIRHGLFHEAIVRKVILHHTNPAYPPIGFVVVGGLNRLAVDPAFMKTRWERWAK